MLDEQLALTYEYGLVELRTGACPVPVPSAPVPTRGCVRFDERDAVSVGPNPLELDGVGLTVFDTSGRPAEQTALVEQAGILGLDGGGAVQIGMPAGCDSAELVLLATGGAAVQADGGVIRELPASTDAQTLELRNAGLRSIRVDATEGLLLLVQVCWTIEVAQPAVVTLTPTLSGSPATDQCLIYDFTFPDEQDDVFIDLGVPIVLAVALRQWEAVAAGDVTADFASRRADRVVVYTRTRARSIRVCIAEPPPAVGDDPWGQAATVATNVNFPVRAVNGVLRSGADERQLADSRLLADESYDATVFGDVVRMLNEAASVNPDVVPVWSTTLTRRDPKDDFVEVRSWAYATLPKLDAPWRRMLGLAYLDGDKNLTAGQAYDYRIVGRFRRRDVAERLLGFHTVPLGATLPATFALDDVLLTTPRAATVTMIPGAGPADLEATGRKGVVLRDAGAGCLRVELPSPVLRIALDVDPGHKLSYTAQSTGALIGPAPVSFAGAVPARSHAVLDFTAPVDTIEFAGDGIFYGLRTGADPAADPDEVLIVTEEILGVVYEPTPGPLPPTSVTAENLQVPPAAAPASRHPPPRPLGFRVSWLPPSAGATGAWPPDLAATPPLDVMSFGVERQRADTNGPWQAIAAKTAFFGSRGGPSEPFMLYPGQDLLSVFPERRPPQPPVSPFMQVEDQLERTGADPPPGRTHRYRVYSVDVLGRVSAPAESLVIRLEKHEPPPQPAGRQDAQVPTGVTARLLQASDPALPPADAALLGGAAIAVVIEWGWTAEQRTRDPYMKEFRLYWDSTPPDQVNGALTGVAAPSATGWTMAATMQRAVAANSLAGRYVQAGERPFQVTANTAGTSISVELARSAIDPPLAPTAAAFVFQPVLDGSELRPSGWERRSAIVPLTADDSYRHVFAETVMLDAAHPLARVWTGVSAADTESYVVDELPAAAPNGGRPGNESSIVPAPAAGRWIGRPAWTSTVPLPDVPEQRTNEPVGNDVRAVVDLPSLLAGAAIPAGHTLAVERLPLSDVVAALSATAADEIRLSPPEGASVEYTLGDASDNAALLAQLRSAEPATVERRFLMDALLNHQALEGFEDSWRPAVAGSVALGPVEIVLSAQAERYALRVRIADEAARTSAESAVLGVVLRVPSLRVPGLPVLTVTADETDAIHAGARVREVPDLSSVLFFSTEISSAGAPQAELLRTPNRPDLYPNAGIRVRLADGALLSPTVVATAAGVSELPDRICSATLVAGYERQVAVWAAALTRDGVPSRLSGPGVATTGPQPLVVPALAVTTAAGADRAAWSTPAVAAETALQRADGAGEWAQVSPWLPPAITSYDLPAGGARRYRLVLRASRNRHATGPEVIPT